MQMGAKHLSAPKANKVQMSAAPYRGAPIRTSPAHVVGIKPAHPIMARECVPWGVRNNSECEHYTPGHANNAVRHASINPWLAGLVVQADKAKAVAS